jgi:hypothetical protein
MAILKPDSQARHEAILDAMGQTPDSYLATHSVLNHWAMEGDEDGALLKVELLIPISTATAVRIFNA